MRNVRSFISRPVRMIFSLLMMVLFVIKDLQAQEDFDFPCVATSEHTFPQVVAGTALATITIEGLGVGTTTMTLDGVSYEDIFGETPWCPGPNCASPQVLFGLTITNTGSTITVTGTPDAAAAGKTIIFVVLANKTGFTPCQRTFKLPIVRKPIDFMVILDRSGSMGYGYDGSTSAVSPNTRWDGLLTGIGVLKTNLQGLNGFKPGDMVGMRMFATSPAVVIPAAPFNGGLVAGTTNAGSLSTVLGGVTPSGGTSLGDGIIAGRDLLLPGTAGNNKTMIVFSDGMQNSGDMVKTGGADQYTNTISNKKLSGPSNEIKIHTICLGSSGHNPMLMQGIAGSNGGLYMNTVAGAEADFNTFFATNLETILKGSSPQLVDITKGTFAPAVGDTRPTANHSFFVDKGASSVVITVMAPTRVEAHFKSVTRDGVNLIQFGQNDRGPGYFSIAFQLNNVPGNILAGEWKVGLELGTVPKTPTPYTIMVMIDDHSVKPDYTLGAGNFVVGSSISPKASLLSLGRSVNNATIQAIIAKPGDDLNDLLARANVQYNVPPGDPGSPDVAKLAVLMQDSAFMNKIKSSNQVVTLTFNAPDSTYSGTFNGLDVTGPYQVVYKATADHPTLGKIQRYFQGSFYVRFADIDQENSQLTVTTNASGNSVITFKPIAKNKKLIGVGWGAAITIDAGGLQATNTVDKGDGSYEVTLNGKISGPVKISVAGVEVFNGDTDGLACYGPNANFWQKIKCWLMSLGLPAWTIWILMLLIFLLLLMIIRKFRK